MLRSSRAHMARLLQLIAAFLFSFSAAYVDAETVISGKVMERSHGTPVADANVRVQAVLDNGQIWIVAQTTAGADGSYSLIQWTTPTPGELLRVQAEAPGYLEALQEFDAGQSEVHLDFSLARTSSISGRVHLPDGSSADNLSVSAEIAVSGGWASRSGRFQSDGHYVIENLVPGTYRVCAGDMQSGVLPQCFDHMNRASFLDEPAFSPVALGIEDQRTGVDFDLVTGGRISGSLLDAHANRPLGTYDFRLTFFDATGHPFDSVELTTDVNGVYEARGLPAGEFHVSLGSSGPFRDRRQVYPDLPCSEEGCDATQGQRLVIRKSEGLTGIDFRFHPDTIIKGRIVNAEDGTGIGGALINGYYPWSSVFGTMAKIFWSTRSRADGTYELYLLGSDADPVRYYVAAEQMAPYINTVYPAYPCTTMTNCVFRGTPLTVRTGATMEDIDITAPVGVAASGKLTDITTGRSLPGHVVFYDQDGLAVWSGRTDPDGTYRTDAWPAGVAYASAVAFGQFQVCGVYLGRPCPDASHTILDVNPTPIILQAGQIRKGVDFPLDVELIFRGTFDP